MTSRDLSTNSPEAAELLKSANDVSWAAPPGRETAIVVDLPGSQAIGFALKFAPLGYQPIPLYNACPAPNEATAVVNVRPILTTLAAAAPLLGAQQLPANASPVFLLDADRNPAIRPMPGQFDNRSISLPTDFPSANLLQSHGIRRVVLMQAQRTEPRADLSHTLRRWQDASLKILALAIDSPACLEPITVQRPKHFRLLWYSVLAQLGLKASPLGGFGGRLPMPSVG